MTTSTTGNPQRSRRNHWRAGCPESGHVRFGGRPRGKGPAPLAPRRAVDPTQFSKDCFGLDQSQVRLHTAIARHTVLVMAALAICAVTAALLRDRTNTQAPAPIRPCQPPPADPGMIPLTVPEIARLLTTLLPWPAPPGHAARWLDWRRRPQARSPRYHQPPRLTANTITTLVS